VKALQRRLPGPVLKLPALADEKRAASGQTRHFVMRESDKWQRVIREAKVTRD
jgi:hypothetical protein